MTRDEFEALPLRTALGVIYDTLERDLADVEKPFVPRPPKYDDRYPKKKGLYVWVSEMTLDDMIFWRGKKAESAAGGGQWAEKDAKWVTKFDKWIAWRQLFPAEVWSGTRGDERATAAPPSREPELHPWEGNGKKRNSEPPPTAGGGGYSDADYGSKSEDDDFIPFVLNVTTEPSERWWKKSQ